MAILNRQESPWDRLERTLDHVSSATASRLGALPTWGREEVLGCLPDRKIEGALLPVDTRAHWGFAALSALLAGVAFVWAFRAEGDDLVRCAQMALFTATVGIAGFHALIDLSEWAHGASAEGWAAAVVTCLGSIEAAYRIADDETRSFFVRLLGFAGSVGLCEELCKAAPLVVLARGPTVADRRTWLLYGIASGLGFGLAEAVSYAGGSYNGMATGQTYLVRYVSCVALHGALCASVALSLQRRLAWLTASWWSGRPIVALATALAWPILAHALYDVLLEERLVVLALATDLACLAWLGWQLEANPLTTANASTSSAPVAAARARPSPAGRAR